MNEDILKKLAVRIEIKSNGSVRSIGSGVIIKNEDNEYFVLTAEHCIYGKTNDRFENVELKDINIFHRQNDDDDFDSISIESIAICDQSNDILSFKIGNLNGRANGIYYESLENRSLEEKLYFRGFPKWLGGKANNYICQHKGNESSYFTIKSEEINDSSLLNGIEETAHGLSGSGVFILLNDSTPCLVGILTDLRDESGTFGHLQCRKLHDFFCENKFSKANPIGLASLLDKNKEIDDNYIVSNIAKLKQERGKEFEDILRKCTLAYGEKEANNMTDLFLKCYFEAEILINSNPLYSECYQLSLISIIEETLMSYNKRKINSKDEAQIIIQDIRSLFEGFFKEKLVTVTLTNQKKVSQKAVAKLLLNCNLDFIPL